MVIPFDYEDGEKRLDSLDNSEAFRNSSIICSRLGPSGKIYLSSTISSGEYQDHFPLELAHQAYSQFFLPSTVHAAANIAII